MKFPTFPFIVLCASTAWLGSGCDPAEPAGLPRASLFGKQPERSSRGAGLHRFAVDPEMSSMTLHAIARARNVNHPVRLEVQSGGFSASYRGSELEVDDFELAVSDINALAETFPPSGIPLERIRARLRRPQLVPLSGQGDEVNGTLEADVVLEWAAGFGDSRLALTPIHMRVRANVSLQRQAGAPRVARLSGTQRGVFWEWPLGGLELADLEFQLTAVPQA
jgi:hypothetical protein